MVSSEKDGTSGRIEIADNLEENLDIFKEIFHYPFNVDFLIRGISIGVRDTKGALVFIQGMVDENMIQENIILPLIEKTSSKDTEDDVKYIIDNILTAKSIQRLSQIGDIVEAIIQGNTLLLLDGYREAICINNTLFERRNIDKPLSETTVFGPKEAFTESADVNRSLIRKQLKTEDLVTEMLTVGERDSREVYIMYIQDVADPELIDKVRTRIQNIKADSVQQIPILQQFIEDRPYSIIPTILYTERPDRAAAFLREGHVVILMDTSGACLVAPATFWAFFQTGEDSYRRWASGNYIRFIRFASMIIALLIPGFYIAITNFHSEMIPSDLLMAIAANRERMPFPALIEILLMETTFELLREAGLRIPTNIGPTIGIVGALILGQAAVQANIVSPILVIVVSITGLSAFALPELGISFVIRIWRFFILFAAAFLGFYGVAVVLTVSIAYVSTIESFGVPFFSPFAPHYSSSRDLVTRSPVWRQLIRPMNLKPLDKIRMFLIKGGNKNS